VIQMCMGWYAIGSIRADLFPSINFNNSKETELSEIQKLDHFKNTLNDNEFLDTLRCPRNISAIHGTMTITIEMNSRGFKVLQPSDIQLDYFTHLIKIFMSKNEWQTISRSNGTFRNASVAVLDTGCKQTDQITASLEAFYGSHDIVMDNIAAHSLEQISAGLIKGMYELITISELCKLPEILNETLARYLLTTVGMQTNPCEIEVCTMNAHQFKKDCYQIIAVGMFALICFQFYLFVGRKTVVAKWLKNNLPIFQLCWPAPLGRINIVMETLNRTRLARNQKESTCSDNTLQTSDLSSDSEFQSFRANNVIRSTAIKKLVRGDRKVILTMILMALFFLFMSVFVTPESDLQNNYCNLLESIRQKIF